MSTHKPVPVTDVAASTSSIDNSITAINDTQIFDHANEPSLQKSEEITTIKDEKAHDEQDIITSANAPVTNEFDNSIPQESNRPSSNINPQAILVSTLDGLASFSSKLNPFAQKFGKGLGQVRQYAEEKFGTAEDITELPQEYKDLEKRVDVLAQLHQNFLKVTKTYNTAAYDYPVQLQESLKGFTSTVSNHIQQLSKSVSDRAQTEEDVAPMVNKPEHPKTLSHALGRVASEGADKVGKDEALGAALDKFGTVSGKLGNARLTMDHEIVSKFNTPLQVTLKTSIEGAVKARRQVQVKRLMLDAAKTRYRESSTQQLDAARLEVEQAEDEFVGAVEEATHAMTTVLEDPEPLRNLADFAQIQLAFFKEAQELFSELVPELEEIRVTQGSVYRHVVDEHAIDKE